MMHLLNLSSDDMEALVEHREKGYKNFYKYVIPKIVVNYADEGASTCTDVLTNIVLSKRSFKAAQGDKSMKVDLDGIAMGGISLDG